MKKIGAVGITFLLYTASMYSTTGKDEPTLNFYGTLIFRDGAKHSVENITINNRTEITAYKIPNKKEEEKLKKELIKGRDNKTRTHTMLESNPVEVSISHKLSSTKTISVPNSYTSWIFQHPNKPHARKIKYTEVIIDGDRFLIPKNTTIGAKDSNTDAPFSIKKISRLKQLTIEGSKEKMPKPEKKEA